MLPALLALAALCAFQAHVPLEERKPGVTLRVYRLETAPDAVPRLAEGQTPNADDLRPRVDFRGEQGFLDVPPPFYSTVSGWIEVSVAGTYRFRLTSDDGSRLSLDGRTLVDNDGRHGALARDSAPIELAEGLHAFWIEHFDGGGQRVLRLDWQPPGAPDFASVPAEALWTERDNARVTAPGLKRLADERRAGDGKPVAGVHPAWTLSTLRPAGFEPRVGAMAFLPDGRLLVGTFSPLQRDEHSLPDIDAKEPDKLFALSNVTSGDSAQVQVRVAADGLHEPMGLCVAEGELYVAHRLEVARLSDLDGDGYFESRERIAAGWEGWNYHQFTRGLVHKDGKLYVALSTSMAPPGWEGMVTNSGPNGPLRGCVLEIELKSGDVRVIAGGARTPNGLGLGPGGALFYTDNQGAWMPTSQLAEVVPGSYFGHANWTRLVPKLAERYPAGGHASAWCDRLRAPPAVWLPHNECTNSPTDPLWMEEGPYAGQMLVGELTAGGIRRVFLERVDGAWQGAVFQFTQGLESGVNRLVRGPDGALYVGGIGAGGNWNWQGTRFGLQRLAFNGRPVFELRAVRALPQGLEIELTDAVDPGWLAEPGNYTLRQWTYAPTAAYGGPKIDATTLPVREALPAENGRSVRLAVEGLLPGSCVHLRLDPTSVGGELLWSTEAWYTLTSIPRAEAPRASLDGKPLHLADTALGVGAQPGREGVRLLNGASAPAMRFAGKSEHAGELSQDDLIARPAYVEVGGGSGDLVSTTVFGDCRLHVEWLAPPGGAGQRAGNSGVYLQERYELQVLGTLSGVEPRIDEAGALYGVRAPSHNASAGPGRWQAYDVWFRAPRFEGGAKVANARVSVFWNGVLVHDDVELPRPTGSAAAGGESGEGVQLGALRLQDHASDAEGPVRYRNIWIAPLAPLPEGEGAWIDLLRTELVARGGRAAYRIANGVLIGTSTPGTPNSFLTTAARYGDFELTFEALLDPRLNSGVQLRSEVLGGFDERSGALQGYQVELDPSARAWTAGLYEERGRGWLHPLHAAPYARTAFRPGDWNRIRVVARGPRISTWINGVPAADVLDAARPAGHIAFQVHSVGELAEPLEVRFRNVRLRPLGRP